MKYDILENGKGVSVERDGMILEFLFSRTYAGSAFGSHGKSTIYIEVNQYLSTLSPAVLDKIFTIFMNYSPHGSFIVSSIRYLNGTVDELYRLLQVESKLIGWVNSTLQAPEGIKDKMIEGKNHTMDKTYMCKDYLDLVVCSMVMKILTPYVFSIYPKLDTYNSYKPMAMSGMLPKALFRLPWSDKLMTYVRSYATNSDQHLDKAVLYSMDQESSIQSVYSTLIIVKLITGPIQSPKPNCHLITHLHSLVKSKFDLKHKKVSPKNLGKNTGGTEEDSESDFQAYRSKDNIPVASQVEIEYTVDPIYMARMVDRFIPKTKHARYARLVLQLTKKNLNIIDEIVYICNWVSGTVVHPKAFDVLPAHKLYPVVAFTYLLLEDKHPFMATFLLTNVQLNKDGRPVHSSTNVGNVKLQQDVAAKLEKMFPIYTGKGRGGKPGMISKITGMLKEATNMNRTIIVNKNGLCAATKACIVPGTGLLKLTNEKRLHIALLLLDLENLLVNVSTTELPNL